MSFHYRYRKQIIIISIIVLILVGSISFATYKYLDKKDHKKKDVDIVEKKKNTKKEDKKQKEEKEEEEYLIDIKGQVNNPGIYRLKINSRVIDCIDMAGGLTENANTSVINLSKKIKDEMVIIVYSNDEVADFVKTKEEEAMITNGCIAGYNGLNNDACITEQDQEYTGKVNINIASIEELMTLPGIGESKAKSIIEYRESNGSFNNIEDIKNVSGIGDNIFDQIKEVITT